jgi:hypothetical protein
MFAQYHRHRTKNNWNYQEPIKAYIVAHKSRLKPFNNPENHERDERDDKNIS